MNEDPVLSSSAFVSSVDMSDEDKRQIIAASEDKGLSIDDYMVDGEFRRNAWIEDVLSELSSSSIEAIQRACAGAADDELVGQMAAAVKDEIERRRTPDSDEFWMMFRVLNQHYGIKRSDYAAPTGDATEYFNSWMEALTSRLPTENLREHLSLMTHNDGATGLRFRAIMEAELQRRANDAQDSPANYPVCD